VAGFAKVASCTDLTPERAALASESAESMQAFLRHVADIARPGEGCPKVLMALARLATDECAWFEGMLRIELTESEDAQGKTALDVFAENGGVRERAFPQVLLFAPLDEFQRAVRLAPHLIVPLTLREEEPRLVLGASAAVTAPPPAFEVSEESLLPPAANPHTRPTVRQMEAIDPALYAELLKKK
jgi:hypothetical protein